MRVSICLLILAALPLNATAAFAEDDSDESKAIAKIELLGGTVTKDETRPGRPAVEIDFRGTQKFNDKYVPLLNSLESLTTLNLADVPISDEGLKKICKLQNLKSLDLSGTQITDVGLKEIKGLENLTALSLRTKTFTDIGMKELAGLTNLTSLDLSGTLITDVGLR